MATPRVVNSKYTFGLGDSEDEGIFLSVAVEAASRSEAMKLVRAALDRLPEIVLSSGIPGVGDIRIGFASGGVKYHHIVDTEAPVGLTFRTR